MYVYITNICIQFYLVRVFVCERDTVTLLLRDRLIVNDGFAVMSVREGVIVVVMDLDCVGRTVMSVREGVIVVVRERVRVRLIVRESVPVTQAVGVTNKDAGIVPRDVKLRDCVIERDGVPVTQRVSVLAKDVGKADELRVILIVILRVGLIVVVCDTDCVTVRVILTDFVGVTLAVIRVRLGVIVVVRERVRVMLIESDGVPVPVRNMVVGRFVCVRLIVPVRVTV